VIVKALALFLGIFVVSVFVTALELIAEHVDTRIGLDVYAPKPKPNSALSFVLVRIMVVDLPLGAMSMLAPNIPRWWLASIVPIAIGRHVMAQGYLTRSPSIVALGRAIYLIPEGIAFCLPLVAGVAWLVLGRPH